MTYSSVYYEGVKSLKEAGIAEAELDARLLLEYVMNTDRNTMYAHGDMDVPSGKITEYTNLIKRRFDRIPLQHIIGTTGFMGLTFYVSDQVLIPRQDSECLVEEALIHVQDGDSVLDMCTGSGCLLISIMKYKNDICGLGADISDSALKIAMKNAESILLDQSEQPQFIKSNLFSDIPKKHEKSFDVIVSNPPYIRCDVIDTLEPEVKDHEPRLALDGGADGLDFYRKITEGAKDFLKAGGCLMYEIGYDQAKEVKDIMEGYGYKDIRIIKDLAGLDRVVSGYL